MPMNRSIVPPPNMSSTNVPSLNLPNTIKIDAEKTGTFSSRRKQSYREQLWDDSSQIERLVSKIQKRAGLPVSIKEMRESREIYDNILDESKSDMISLRQSYERKLPDKAMVKIKLSMKKKKTEESRNRTFQDSDAVVMVESARDKNTPREISVKKKQTKLVPIFSNRPKDITHLQSEKVKLEMNILAQHGLIKKMAKR